MFKFFIILSFLAIVQAGDKEEYDHLCDYVPAQTHTGLAPYMRGAPMIFETQDVRIVWYDGTKNYLGKVGKPDVRRYAPVSKGKKTATKSKNSSKFLAVWGREF